MIHCAADQIAAAVERTASAIRKRAAKESWPCIEVQGNGGLRKEYFLSQLPPAVVQAALTAASLRRILPKEVPAPTLDQTHMSVFLAQMKDTLCWSGRLKISRGGREGNNHGLR